jgi:hypothetical protein
MIQKRWGLNGPPETRQKGIASRIKDKRLGRGELQTTQTRRAIKGVDRTDDETPHAALTLQGQIPLLARDVHRALLGPMRAHIRHEHRLGDAFPLEQPARVEIDIGARVERLVREVELRGLAGLVERVVVQNEHGPDGGVRAPGDLAERPGRRGLRGMGDKPFSGERRGHEGAVWKT